MNTTNGELIMRMIILGIGLGTTMPIFTLAVQSAFPKERLGEVTAGSQLFRNVGGTVGTAVLGGIMNIRLTEQIDQLKQEPFLAEMKQFDIGQSASHFDGSFIQSVLNQENQQHIKSLLDKLPPEYHSTALTHFNHFLDAAKADFSSAVSYVFLVASGLIAIALILVCFLPQIPLRSSKIPRRRKQVYYWMKNWDKRTKNISPGRTKKVY